MSYRTNYGGSQWQFQDYGLKPSETDKLVSKSAFSAAPMESAEAGEAATAGASAGGAGMGPAAVSAGGSALVGILQMIHQQELERQRKIEAGQERVAGGIKDYGSNQQDVLQKMLGNWNKALGV